MRDVVIVGGGLTGLAAAFELERMQIPYTLIEVKKRLGGGTISDRRDGFLVDGGMMAVRQDADWSFLPEIGLADDALIPVDDGFAVFQNGTQMLVDALAKPLTGTKMTRMAVSSLGMSDQCFGVCFENGLVLEARALIVTAPARYADHMLFDLVPEVGKRLTGYRYDTITRLSLGYPRDAIRLPFEVPPDMAFTTCQWTDHPQRAPEGHVLLQIGVRLPYDPTHSGWMDAVLGEMNLPAQPVLTAAYFWPESDPLTCHEPEHQANLAAIESLLPEGVVLAGSDYRAFDLSQRIIQGRAAARKIATFLGK